LFLTPFEEISIDFLHLILSSDFYMCGYYFSDGNYSDSNYSVGIFSDGNLVYLVFKFIER